MFKQIAALLITACISCSASAAFVQYDFSTGGRGNGISGYFVQDSETHRLAYYTFTSTFFNKEAGYLWSITYFPSGIFGTPTSVSKATPAPGPVNFSIDEYLVDERGSTVNLTFHGAGPGLWAAVANMYLSSGQSFTGYGGATAGAVKDPQLLLALEAGVDLGLGNWTPVVTGRVPEPATAALLLAGIAGWVAARRRKFGDSLRS